MTLVGFEIVTAFDMVDDDAGGVAMSYLIRTLNECRKRIEAAGIVAFEDNFAASVVAVAAAVAGAAASAAVVVVGVVDVGGSFAWLLAVAAEFELALVTTAAVVLFVFATEPAVAFYEWFVVATIHRPLLLHVWGYLRRNLLNQKSMDIGSMTFDLNLT